MQHDVGGEGRNGVLCASSQRAGVASAGKHKTTLRSALAHPSLCVVASCPSREREFYFLQIGALRLPGVLGSVLEEDASQGQGRQAQERGPPPQILFAFVSPSDSREKRTDSLRAKLLLRLQACQWLGFRVRLSSQRIFCARPPQTLTNGLLSTFPLQVVPVGLWELRGRSAEEVHSIAKNYVHSAAQTGVTA